MDKYYAQTRHEMIDFIPGDNTGRVLDVGCGQGMFATLVKERFDSEVWGVEPVEDQARVAQNALDKVLLGGLDDVYDDLPKNYFDCIVFNDVLEHMVDPCVALKNAKSLLDERGVIVCSIPNVRYFPVLFELLVRRDWRYRDSGVLDRTHLRFFTKKSIRLMFEGQGYVEKRISGINRLKSKKMLGLYYAANIVTFGLLADSKFQQYACVMVPKR